MDPPLSTVAAAKVATTNKNLLVPEYSLQAGTNYTFTLIVSAHGYAGSSAISVSVMPVGPFAVVRGGNRLISASVNASDVILDASKSRNNNFSPTTQASYATKVYSWSCVYRNRWNQMDTKLCRNSGQFSGMDTQSCRNAVPAWWN